MDTEHLYAVHFQKEAHHSPGRIKVMRIFEESLTGIFNKDNFKFQTFIGQ